MYICTYTPRDAERLPLQVRDAAERAAALDVDAPPERGLHVPWSPTNGVDADGVAAKNSECCRLGKKAYKIDRC